MTLRLALGILLWSEMIAASQEGVINLQIKTNFGEAVSPGRITIRSSDGKISLAPADTVQLAATKLPFGAYTVLFESSGWQRAERRISLDRPELLVTIAVIPDSSIIDIENSPVALALHVQPVASCHSQSFLWAKLVALFGDSVSEIKLSVNGFGLFEPIQPGKYEVLIIDNGDVRASLPVVANRPVNQVTIKPAPCR